MNIKNLRKGQLIRRLIKDYKYHISYIKNNLSEASNDSIIGYCKKVEIEHGVCSYISFGLNIGTQIGYNLQWVKKYLDADLEIRHWGKRPTDVHVRLHNMEFYKDPNLTQELILQSYLDALQLRVDILEKELNSGDKLHQRLNSSNYYS